MQRCIDLAMRGRGLTSPNPLVGSVIVKDNQVIGEGYHQKAGGRHAEVWALEAAGERAQGATLYVNLEPCCHYGRTPPCTERIIAAGISRVVVGMEDPNPKVAGKGMRQLLDADIEVVGGVCEQQARSINEIFIKYISTKKPFVLWKAACSMDGKVAVGTGDSRWVTGKPARAEVHRTRAMLDGIMVGSGTIIHDDPLLTARPLPERLTQPTRIILDGRGRIPITAKILNSSEFSPVIWVVGQDVQVETTDSSEVTVVHAPDPTIDINWVLSCLGQQGITSVMLEGGPTLATGFWQAKAIDKVQMYMAPKLVGRDGLSVLGPLHYQWMMEATALKSVQLRQVGEDFCFEGYPSWS